MTSSFGITPQRQIRDLVAQPEKPAALPAPAQPSAIPQQVGGQLMYAASYQRDTAAEQGIRNIENFLADNGVFDRGSKALFENYKAEKKQQAQRLFQQEAKALYDTVQNTNEVKELQKKGDTELAKKTQLSNPWVNFFYYDAKATNAGQQTAVELAAWAKSNVINLAEIDDPAQRSILVAQKAQELLTQYADIPEAFKAAKIDPLLAATQADIKADIANKAFERRERVMISTAREKLLGKWKLGASLSKATNTTQFDRQSIAAGVLEFRKTLEGYGYKSQFITDTLNNLFRKDDIFIDLNNDQLSDIGNTYTSRDLFNALEPIKVDGISILDLVDSKGDTLRRVIRQATSRAIKESELHEGSIERTIQRQQRESKRIITDRSSSWWANNPNPTNEQIADQIKIEINYIDQLNKANLLPDGFGPQNAKDFVRDLYKFNTNKVVTPEEQADLIQAANNEIANGVDSIPDYLKQAAEGTPVYSDLIKMFGEAKRKNTAGDKAQINTVKGSLIKTLVDGLKDSFNQDEDFKRTRQLPRYRQEANAARDAAVSAATPLFKGEASVLVERELRTAKARNEDINDPNVQTRILKEVQSKLYGRDEFKNVDRYINVANPSKIGTVTSPVPILSSRDTITGQWTNLIKDTDSRASWSSLASATYGNNPKVARQALNSYLMLNSTEIGEINNAIINPDAKLSFATKQSLSNLNQIAFKNNIPISEIIERQMKTYYSNQFLPQNLSARAKALAKTIRSVAAVTGPTPTDIGIEIYDWNHSHSINGSGNAAIDFTPVRQNGQLGNNVPSPISGRVVFAGRDGGYGLSIIIEAATSGPGYNKNDRIRFAHLARLYWKAGDTISRGRPVGKSGDSSAHDSRPGYSGTGDGDPGHVHVQRYRPGKGVPKQADQYQQIDQAKFVKEALVPLFRRK